MFINKVMMYLTGRFDSALVKIYCFISSYLFFILNILFVQPDKPAQSMPTLCKKLLPKLQRCNKLEFINILICLICYPFWSTAQFSPHQKCLKKMIFEMRY